MLMLSCGWKSVCRACRFRLVLIACVLCGSVAADEPLLRLVPEDSTVAAFSGGTLPRTTAVLDDATLLDVCSVGSFCGSGGTWHGVSVVRLRGDLGDAGRAI
ncbi:MAG UNVERIFIED_CONTAM: hypothetical protein LVR18_18605 [Planctomycetaceae bacterium]|jgi:hypothetical protein